MVKKAYPGTISSVILSVLVVILLLVPFYTANHLEKVRNGEDEYEFKEVICFDISKKDEFESDDFHSVPDPYPWQTLGTGAFDYYYKHTPYNGGGRVVHVHQPIFISTTPIEGTVDGYGISKVVYDPDYEQHLEGYYDGITIWTNITKEKIIECDATSIVIYLDIGNYQYTTILSLHFYVGNTLIIVKYDVNIGDTTKIDLSVNDLLNINSLGAEDKIKLLLTLNLEPVIDDSVVIFDMQFYHIKEFKIITIDWIGIAMTGAGIFMIFCSILMLPHVTFSGVIGRLVGKRS